MSTIRPADHATTRFAADTNKFAYAQAFSRTSAHHAHPAERSHPLRGLGARLLRPTGSR